MTIMSFNFNIVSFCAGLFRRLFAEEQPLYALIEEERQDGHQHALEQVLF